MKRSPPARRRHPIDALARYLALEGFERGAARDVAARVLGEVGSYSRLRSMGEDAVTDLFGAGPGFAVRVRAALELAEAAGDHGPRPLMIQTADDVFRWSRARLLVLPHEELWVLALDAQSRLRAARRVAQGGIDALGVLVRDVLRVVLLEAASAFVLVHNHPSGDPTPSREDERMTREVTRGAYVIGVPLVDHVVVGTYGYCAISASSLLAAPTGSCDGEATSTTPR